MLTPEEIKERQNCIGASDVPTIMGFNSQYKTPYDLYLEKKGFIDPPDFSKNEKVHFGNVLEPVVAREFSRRNNTKIAKRKNRYRLKDHPYITALLDRVVLSEKVPLELKTTDANNKHKWGATNSKLVPEPYLIQLMTQIMITESPHGYLAVIIGGNDYRQYKFKYNIDLGEIIKEYCIKFWNCIETNTPPDPITNEDLSKVYKYSKSRSKILSSEHINTMHVKIRKIKKLIKKLLEKKDNCEFEVKRFMKNKEMILNANEDLLFTWKYGKNGRRFYIK